MENTAEVVRLLNGLLTTELRAINQYFHGDAGGIRRTAAVALGGGSDSGSGYWHSALLTTLGTAQFATGQVEAAAATLERAVDAGVASGHTLALAHALGWAVVAHVENGRPERATNVMPSDVPRSEKNSFRKFVAKVMLCLLWKKPGEASGFCRSNAAVWP